MITQEALVSGDSSIQEMDDDDEEEEERNCDYDNWEEDRQPVVLPEIWLHILSFLPQKDLNSVALTCQGLMDLATMPRLWRKVDIKMIRFRTLNLHQFFNIRRFRQLSRLNFTRIKLSESDIRLVLEWSLSSQLFELDMTGLNLSSISPNLLSKSLHRLRKACLGFTKLTTEQTVHLFSYFYDHPGPKPEDLCIKAVNLSRVHPTILATTLAHLRSADVSFTELTVEQVTALFQQILSHSPEVRLTNLDLFSVDLSLVCPNLMAKAVACLTEVSLSNTELRLEHAHALFDHLLKSNTVTNLNVDFAELFSLPVSVLSKAVAKLSKASLACAVLDESQVMALAEAMAEPSSKLTQLDLLDLQLTPVPPNLLVSALSRLSKVNMSGSKLSSQQANCLISDLNMVVMRDLNLDYVDLSSCCPEVLANLTCNLEVASFKKSGLTELQVQKMLSRLGERSHSLISLCLHGNNLSSVDSDILSAAANTLHTLDLSQSQLTTPTADTLLFSLDTPFSSLKSFTLLGNKLGSVSTLALEAALTNLERFDLSSTGLTDTQLEVLLTEVKPPLKELSLFSLDLTKVENVLREAEKRVFVSHRHAAITPDS